MLGRTVLYGLLLSQFKCCRSSSETLVVGILGAAKSAACRATAGQGRLPKQAPAPRTHRPAWYCGLRPVTGLLRMASACGDLTTRTPRYPASLPHPQRDNGQIHCLNTAPVSDPLRYAASRHAEVGRSKQCPRSPTRSGRRWPVPGDPPDRRPGQPTRGRNSIPSDSSKPGRPDRSLLAAWSRGRRRGSKGHIHAGPDDHQRAFEKDFGPKCMSPFRSPLDFSRRLFRLVATHRLS